MLDFAQPLAKPGGGLLAIDRRFRRRVFLGERLAGQRRDQRGQRRGLARRRGDADRGRGARPSGLAERGELALVLKVLSRGRRQIAEVDRVPRRQLLLVGAGLEFRLEIERLAPEGEDAVLGLADFGLERVDLEREPEQRSAAQP